MPPCLEALKRQSMADFDIVIVDNGSNDGSLELLAEKYAEIPVIEMGENTGFCKAVNEGVKSAGTEYVILLNNDTEPRERFVESLVKAMDKRIKAFSCSSRMLNASAPDLMDGAGDLYNALGWAIARGKGKSADKYDKAAKIFSSCAGAAIYRRELFIKLGMLDERHFAYLEDLDLGYRARIVGYENWYVPEAEVLHVGSGSSGLRYNEFKISHSARNNVYVIYKNMPAFQRIINAPTLFLGFMIKYLYFKKRGFGELYKSSLKEGKELSLSEEGRGHALGFEWRNIKNYCKIQLELWGNIFLGRG